MIHAEYNAPIQPTPTVIIARVKVIFFDSLLTNKMIIKRHTDGPMCARVLEIFLTTAVLKMFFLMAMGIKTLRKQLVLDDFVRVGHKILRVLNITVITNLIDDVQDFVQHLLSVTSRQAKPDAFLDQLGRRKPHADNGDALMKASQDERRNL